MNLVEEPNCIGEGIKIEIAQADVALSVEVQPPRVVRLRAEAQHGVKGVRRRALPEIARAAPEAAAPVILHAL